MILYMIVPGLLEQRMGGLLYALAVVCFAVQTVTIWKTGWRAGEVALSGDVVVRHCKPDDTSMSTHLLIQCI